MATTSDPTKDLYDRLGQTVATRRRHDRLIVVACLVLLLGIVAATIIGIVGLEQAKQAAQKAEADAQRAQNDEARLRITNKLIDERVIYNCQATKDQAKLAAEEDEADQNTTRLILAHSAPLFGPFQEQFVRVIGEQERRKKYRIALERQIAARTCLSRRKLEEFLAGKAVLQEFLAGKPIATQPAKPAVVTSTVILPSLPAPSFNTSLHGALLPSARIVRPSHPGRPPPRHHSSTPPFVIHVGPAGTVPQRTSASPPPPPPPIVPTSEQPQPPQEPPPEVHRHHHKEENKEENENDNEGPGSNPPDRGPGHRRRPLPPQQREAEGVCGCNSDGPRQDAGREQREGGNQVGDAESRGGAGRGPGDSSGGSGGGLQLGSLDARHGIRP